MKQRFKATCIDEAGTIAPLAIGLASIMLATTFTFVNVGSLLLFQQRETQQAEALALAVDETVEPETLAISVNENSPLIRQAQKFALEAGIGDFEVITTDGKTVFAKVCGSFHAPIQVPLLAAIVGRNVCATAKARRS